MGAKFRTILTAALLFIVVFIVVQFITPDKFLSNLIAENGTLRVDSVPKTNVFVDNTLYGQTPLQLSLKAGVHDVKLVPRGSGESLISWTGKVKIFKASTTYINRELGETDLKSAGDILSLEKGNGEKGQILVSTEPMGMFVSLDGEERGVSPLFMDNVNGGEHELSVRGEGMIPRSIKVNIVEGFKLLANFKLKIDEEYQAKKQESKKKPVAKKEEENTRYVLILDTPTGWLRVRSEPSLGASESGRVNPGERYVYVTESNRWYEIEFEEDKTGWVYADYVRIVEEEEGIEE